MYQITYFEFPKCKNSMMCVKGDTPSNTLPEWSLNSLVGHLILEEDKFSVNKYFPMNFWIDNIPAKSPKVCTRSLTLNLKMQENSLVWVLDIPLPHPLPLSRFVPSPVIPKS